MNNAVSYNRKSTDESTKKQLQSIDDQIRINREVANRLGFAILDEFKESKSASKMELDNRTQTYSGIRLQFKEMIKNIYSGKYDTVICWKADRLARNPADGSQLLAMLQKGILKKIITSEKEYTVNDMFMLNIEFGMATEYTQVLSKNVRRGIQSKAMKGWPTGQAKLGYLNNKFDIVGQKTWIVDEVRFPLIRKMVDMMLTGLYTPPQILKVATEDWGFRSTKGKKIALSTMYRIFTSDIYRGMFMLNGEWYKGSYTPLITDEEFDRIQYLLGRKGNTRAKTKTFAYSCMINVQNVVLALPQRRNTKNL